MKKQGMFYFLGLTLVFFISGCAVRTYSVIKDRVDQGLSEGNRGYLVGTPSLDENKDRETTRTTQVVEVELGSSAKFGKSPKYKVESSTQETKEPLDLSEDTAQETTVETGEFKKYTVQKNDTLQKISQKFYGTTKKWTKIFNANKNTLKKPDRIRFGQELKIPIEEEKGASKNLK